jgi:UDP-galactopyranose mutase
MRLAGELPASVDALVVGAGFAGAVVGERLADAGLSVLVVERRGHIGGNAYDYYDEHGILIHRYGPHIFHTNSDRIVAYLSRFTDWRPYEHRVLSQVRDGLLVPMPVNRTTINAVFGKDFDAAEAAAFLASQTVDRDPVRTSEDVVLAAVGPVLCDLLYRGYTRKQWGLDLSELSASVAARLPVRTNDDDRYFTDRFQQMPAEGYTRMFERILDHPRIAVATGIDDKAAVSVKRRLLVWTGAIDAFFGHRFGRLPYRSLRFEHRHLPGVEFHFPVGSINYPNQHDYTRITEFKRLTGQNAPGTTIAHEYPSAEGEPYYPIPRPENAALYRRYRELADEARDTFFVGRLAEYQYFNMDQVVASALKTAERILSAN